MAQYFAYRNHSERKRGNRIETRSDHSDEEGKQEKGIAQLIDTIRTTYRQMLRPTNILLFSLGSIFYVACAWQQQTRHEFSRLERSSAIMGVVTTLYGIGHTLGTPEVAHAGDFADPSNSIRFSFPDNSVWLTTEAAENTRI